MKINFTHSLLWFVLFVLITNLSAIGQEAPKTDKPVTLKHWMTPEEARFKHLIGKDAQATEPPDGPVTNIAEFEKMQSVLIRYSFGIPYNLIAGMSQKTMITTIVANTSEQTYVTNQYNNNGVNMDNTEFLIAPSDSYWTRDYGPWFVIDGNDELGIVDFTYNRPRPTDNAIPSKIAAQFGYNLFEMDIITAGGNYMTDGMGISASSDLIWEENASHTQAEIEQIFEDYLGIHTYHVVDDPNNTYIDHIDCWGKFLDVDKVLIRSVPESHPQFDEIEATADYFANQISSFGNNYQVYRVYTPNNQPYTNSLILNEQVFVPITNSQWDDEALAAYQEAMPGYEVYGYTGSWESTDAIHCRTKGIADQDMIHLAHYPLLGNQPIQTSYDVEATVKAFSGANLDSVLVYYQINGATWQSVNMTNTSGKTWTAAIPGAGEGSQVDYYIYAVDENENRNSHPFIGRADPHMFFVGQQAFAHIEITPEVVSVSAPEGQSASQTISICNTGQLELNYSISSNTAVYGDVDYEVEDSPAAGSYDYNTWTEANWTEFEVTDSGQIDALEVSFTWDTDNYSNEGSFLLLSPEGLQATIASGLTDGTYTVDMNAFAGEEMNGTWRMWIEDTYGDGGHQATDINVNFSHLISNILWVAATPASGTIAPDDCVDVEIVCDAAGLTAGMHEGTLSIASNDPDFPEIEIPVQFEVIAGLQGSIVTSPDTLWFMDANTIYEGLTATILNNSTVDVTITEIQENNWTEFGWWTQNLSQSLPYTLAPDEEMTFDVFIETYVLDLVYMGYDSVHVSSDAGDNYVNIAIDILLIPGAIDENEHSGVQVYPSPFRNELTIDLSKYNNTVDKVTISDLSGRIVKVFDQNMISNNQLIWNSQQSETRINEGIYLVQVFANNKYEVIKVLKMD